jgi:hypothetical protein
MTQTSAALAHWLQGMSLDSSSEVSSVMYVEAAASEAATEAEAANTEGWIFSVNSGRIVRVEGNKCGSRQLASSMKNLYELSIHSSKSSVSGGSSGAGSQQDKPSAAV